MACHGKQFGNFPRPVELASMFPDVREALTPPSGQRLCCGEGREGRHRRAGACPARTDLLSALIQSLPLPLAFLSKLARKWRRRQDHYGEARLPLEEDLASLVVSVCRTKSAWSPPSFNAHDAVATSTIHRPDLLLTSPLRWQVGHRYRDSFPAPPDRAQRAVLSRCSRSRHETDQPRPR